MPTAPSEPAPHLVLKLSAHGRQGYIEYILVFPELKVSRLKWRNKSQVQHGLLTGLVKQDAIQKLKALGKITDCN